MKRQPILATVLLLLIASCSSPSGTKSGSGYPEPFGQAVFLGNSITAGFIGGGWTNETLNQSYAVLLAERMYGEEADELFRRPEMVGAGVANPAVLNGLTTVGSYADGTPVRIPAITPATQLNVNNLVPRNNGDAKPFHLLAVPGYKLLDLVERTGIFNSLFETNPLGTMVIRDKGTALDQADDLDPDLVFLWAGNNEVLGSATNGGTSAPFPIADRDGVPGFRSLITTAMNTLAKPGRTVLVMNAPDVTAIPFVTAVGMRTADGKRGQVLDLDGNTVFTDTLRFYGLEDGVVRMLEADEYVLLPYLLQNRSADVSGGRVYGLHPDRPLADNEWLTREEVATIADATAAINGEIRAAADARANVHLVDMNAFFRDVSENGYRFGGTGTRYTADFATGGLFSLDGVHPAPRGHRVIANRVIQALNPILGTSMALYSDL
jgi:phospholipase/lecithinase/hemolysin